MKFCQRCYDVMVAEWAQKVNYDPKAVLDVRSLRFPCQIPIYESDLFNGEPRVRIWNCKENRFDFYTLKEYNRKKTMGEL